MKRSRNLSPSLSPPKESKSALWKVIYPCLIINDILPGPAVVHGPVVDVAGDGGDGVGGGHRDEVEAVVVHQSEVGSQHLVIVRTLKPVPEFPGLILSSKMIIESS